MANWDNRRWTYQQVLNGGTGIYYMKDDMLRAADGVKTMQSKLNSAGYNTGTPDGKFGSGTDTAVRNFQRASGLTADGKAGKGTLQKLDGEGGGSGSGSKTTGTGGLNIIKKWESERQTGDPHLIVYPDDAKNPTVGWGHKVLPSDNLTIGDRITYSQAEAFLKADLNKAEVATNKHPKISKIRQVQFDAVISLCFNVGTAPVVNPANDLYKALNNDATYAQPISDAAKAAIIKGFTYTRINGKPANGLINRRNEELNLFLGTSGINYIPNV